MSLYSSFNRFLTKDMNLVFHQRYRLYSSISLKLTRCSSLKVPRASHVPSRRYVHVLNEDDISNVSLPEIKRSIKSHFDGFSEGNACLSIECPSCKEKQASKEAVGKLCINFKTGYCFCTLCQLQGSWSLFNGYLNSLGQSKPGKNQPSIKPS